MVNSDSSTSSADKIIIAATELFSANHFNGVSIKDIARISGVNSALISYYFGGKKNLYQAVLFEQSNLFLDLIDKVKAQPASSLEKLHYYVNAVAEVQKLHPHRIHLIYRELLTPSFLCDNLVKDRLYKIHQFMTELATECIADGSIKNTMHPTHIAFTLESLIVFYFLTHNQICDLGEYDEGFEHEYLETVLNTYLTTITI